MCNIKATVISTKFDKVLFKTDNINGLKLDEFGIRTKLKINEIEFGSKIINKDLCEKYGLKTKDDLIVGNKYELSIEMFDYEMMDKKGKAPRAYILKDYGKNEFIKKESIIKRLAELNEIDEIDEKELNI